MRKKEQIKKALKPIIAECVKEILEKGFVQQIMTEAVKAAVQQNAGGQQVIVEKHFIGATAPQQLQNPATPAAESVQQTDEEYEKRMEEIRRQRTEMLSAKQDRLAQVAGLNKSMFQDVQPLMEGGIPDREKNIESRAEAGPLRDINPSDPGVNINGILEVIGGPRTWTNQLK